MPKIHISYKVTSGIFALIGTFGISACSSSSHTATQAAITTQSTSQVSKSQSSSHAPVQSKASEKTSTSSTIEAKVNSSFDFEITPDTALAKNAGHVLTSFDDVQASYNAGYATQAGASVTFSDISYDSDIVRGLAENLDKPDAEGNPNEYTAKAPNGYVFVPVTFAITNRAKTLTPSSVSTEVPKDHMQLNFVSGGKTYSLQDMNSVDWDVYPSGYTLTGAVAFVVPKKTVANSHFDVLDNGVKIGTIDLLGKIVK